VKKRVRADVPRLEEDRILAPDLEQSARWVRDGELVDAARRAGARID